jgi:hypothetical protein
MEERQRVAMSVASLVGFLSYDCDLFEPRVAGNGQFERANFLRYGQYPGLRSATRQERLTNPEPEPQARSRLGELPELAELPESRLRPGWG